MKALALILTSAAAMLFLSACSTTQSSGSAALQGTWSGREPGVVPQAPRHLVVSGNQIEYRGSAPEDWGKGTFQIREETEPKQLLVSVAECGIPQYIGKTCCLIYKVENGVFTTAIGEPGNPVPPASFDAPHARHIIFTKE